MLYLETARGKVEAELEELKSSTSTSTSEVATLKSRVSSLESSNRDTLALLESKSTAHDRLAEDLSTEHQKTVELRRQVSTLEQTIQSQNSAAASTRFREQSLQQEIDNQRRNNEWFESELKTKSAEYTKYRKEKGARITELQRLNEDANSTIDSMKRTENSLRNRLNEVEQKVEDSIGKIQQIQEDMNSKESSFRVELDSASRLAELQRGSAETAKQRAQELQYALEQAKEDAAEELGRIRAELDTEHSERDAAERRVGELESTVDQLRAELAQVHDQAPQIHVTRPGTPQRGSIRNGVSTPGRAGSPPGTPGSARALKGSLNMTQLYTEYSNMKVQLASEKRRNEQLSSAMDEMIQDLESRQPEIEGLRADHSRLEGEIVEMSTLLQDIGKDRDKAKKDARRWESQVAGLNKEAELLRQQLRDLSAQIKVLLLEAHARDEGVENLSDLDRAELERFARGEFDQESTANTSPTSQWITTHMSTYKNIKELQDRNVDLLNITRQLGDKYEGEEARRNNNAQQEEHEELLALRQRVEIFQDEIKSMVTQSQSYIKERDMFRRMLSHRGQLPHDALTSGAFSQSVPAGTSHPAAGSSGATPTQDAADYAKLLKEVQIHFDSYRQEAATDRSALKQQVDGLSRKNSELQGDIARAQSQLSLASERHDMLQANYNMLKNENSQLQQRSQSLSDNAARQDLRTQQVAEDLVEARGLIESMRNETANLKAEKDMWKNIEKRLTEDNEELRNERSRLNTLNGNLQSLLNEREHSDSEVRRRLQANVETLVSELQSTRRKLNEEIEDAKKAALRREFEHQNSQKRIDDLVANTTSVREELVAAKTARDHLQARLDEMTIELRSTEERLQVLQPKAIPQSTEQPRDETEGQDTEIEHSLSREQELAMEVSELKRDLDLANAELQHAKEQVEQYQSISNSAEEQLQSLNETQDQYREEMDQIIGEKDDKIRELEQRVEDISSELSTSSTELNSLRTEQAEHARHVEDLKASYESEIARLKDDDERHATAAEFHQKDLKAQAEIAQQAQQNYENELLKHAEAAKSLQQVRNDLNQLRMENFELKNQADTAKTTLAQSEESWADFRNRYERDLADQITRREDIAKQNNLLHQQLESVSKQIASLQQVRTTFNEEEGDENAASTGLENLQEVIQYLRREKEIVDVQYNLSQQESKRLKQQLDYAQSQLEDTRVKLDQQRRAEADSERNNLTHNQLIEKINELNVFRASTVTLRNEAKEAQNALSLKSKQLEELQSQMEPLKARVQELESIDETRQEEMRLLQEDRDRWQQRTQNILQKYDRVDPAEMDALKEQIATLQTERDEALTTRQSLQEQIDSMPNQLQEAETRWQETRSKLTEQFKARSKELSQRVHTKTTELQAAIAEKEQIQQQLDSLRNELDTVKAERDQAVANTSAQSKPADVPMQNGDEEGEVGEDGEVPNHSEKLKEVEEKLAEANTKAAKEASKAERLEGEVSSFKLHATELARQVVSSAHMFLIEV